MVEGSRAAFGYPPNQASAAHSRSAASQNQTDSKWLFSDDGSKIAARHINGYLVDADDVWVESRRDPICHVPEMTNGSKPVEGGNFFFTKEEADRFIGEEPGADRFLCRVTGSEEYINNVDRYCLWLVGASPRDLRSLPLVMKRVELVREMRLASPKADTRKSAERPTVFQQLRQPDSPYLLIPRVSSEHRRYLPIGFVSPDVIVTDSAQYVPDATLYHFGVLTSSVHMAWMRAVAGRLKSDYRYSAVIVYNNFPWPENVGRIGGAGVYPPRPRTGGGTVDVIERTAQAILDARALYPDSSLADLYDPLTMPPELRKAHAANDAAVMEAYGFAKTLTEDEIVAELFKRYAELAHDCAKDNR